MVSAAAVLGVSDLHEFGSPSWLVAACDISEKVIADSGVDLEGVNYTFGEEFLDLPARLNPSGAARVGWYVRIADGVVTTKADPPPDDADTINLCDWEAIEPLSHHVMGADPARDAELVTTMVELVSTGKLVRTERNPPSAALAEALAPLHNAVVAITGPRQG